MYSLFQAVIVVGSVILILVALSESWTSNARHKLMRESAKEKENGDD